MVLSARADPAVSNQPIANHDLFKTAYISIGGTSAATQTLTVTRGQISTRATLQIPSLTLLPA